MKRQSKCAGVTFFHWCCRCLQRNYWFKRTNNTPSTKTGFCWLFLQCDAWGSLCRMMHSMYTVYFHNHLLKVGQFIFLQRTLILFLTHAPILTLSLQHLPTHQIWQFGQWPCASNYTAVKLTIHNAWVDFQNKTCWETLDISWILDVQERTRWPSSW